MGKAALYLVGLSTLILSGLASLCLGANGLEWWSVAPLVVWLILVSIFLIPRILNK